METQISRASCPTSGYEICGLMGSKKGWDYIPSFAIYSAAELLNIRQGELDQSDQPLGLESWFE